MTTQNENNVLQSASKIVLLAFAVTACVAFLAVVLVNAKTESVVLAVVAVFSGAVSSVMTYYFSKRAAKDGDIKA